MAVSLDLCVTCELLLVRCVDVNSVLKNIHASHVSLSIRSNY